MRPVPVLMYHHVNYHKGDMVTVTQEVFEGQMKHLAGAGYRTLKGGEIIDILEGRLVTREKAVLVTFDDGWLDNYLFAYPILKKYGINATIFLVTNWIEKSSAKRLPIPQFLPSHGESKRLIKGEHEHKVVLNWDLIKEMAGSGLVDFYSHTKSHPKCDQLSEADLVDELAGSKAVIEERLKRPCPYLCWPKGKYNDAAVKAAMDAGYRALFTTNPGVVKDGSDRLAVNRIVVKSSVEWFKMRLFIYTNRLASSAYLYWKKSFENIRSQ